VNPILFATVLFLISVAVLVVVACLCKAASHEPPAANGGTPPDSRVNLDAPTHTRREIEDLQRSGFTVVRSTPPPFAELKPLPRDTDSNSFQALTITSLNHG
jgi:hypothetical protein